MTHDEFIEHVFGISEDDDLDLFTPEILADAFRHGIHEQGMTMMDLTEIVSQAFSIIEDEEKKARVEKFNALDEQETELRSMLTTVQKAKENLV